MDRQEWLSIDASTPSHLQFHVLPCSIKYEGKVDGSKFTVEETPALKARFRGRPLEGKRVDLSLYDYVGHTLEIEEPAPKYNGCDGEDEGDDSANESSYEIREARRIPNGLSFDSLIVWEHGSEPARNDPWAFKLEELLEFAKHM